MTPVAKWADSPLIRPSRAQRSLKPHHTCGLSPLGTTHLFLFPTLAANLTRSLSEVV